MGHSFLDHCNRLDSHVHRLDALVKILAAFAFLVLLVTIPAMHLYSFVLFGGILIWIVAFSHVSLGRLLLRAAAVLPFSIIAALGLLFVEDTRSIDIGGAQVSIKGLWVVLGVSLKSFLGAAMMILLVATTPFDAVMGGLRQLGVPALFVDVMALTYRYILLLVEEAARLRRAAVARGYAPKWLSQAAIVGRLIGNLFLRSYERGERVYGAMLLRGYKGQLPASDVVLWRKAEIGGLIAFVVLLLGIRVFVS